VKQHEKIELDIAKFQKNLEVQLIKQQEAIINQHKAQLFNQDQKIKFQEQNNKSFFGKLKRIK
jgi:hypothetical protein